VNRVYGIPPGADFPALVVRGLRQEMAAAPPEAMARVLLFVNAGRMRRRMIEMFVAEGAGFLPKIRLVTDPGLDPLPGVPPAEPALRRRLELMRPVAALLQAAPGLAPVSAAYDLADALAGLMDEMQGEGVLPEALANLDVAHHAAHWERAHAFIRLLLPYFDAEGAPDPAMRQRLAVAALVAGWRKSPPADPVIVAGDA
jgi:ATP-dependent helicase/nuclease subunit B